nr:alpha-N-acetylgalactosaminide alpha-2,6-sialyltransferase 2-like [Monopterus albus]
MALRSKLVFGVLTIGSLLFIYILCVNLDSRLARTTVKQLDSLKRLLSRGSQDSKDPFDGESSSQWSSLPPASSSGPELSSGGLGGHTHTILVPTLKTRTSPDAEQQQPAKHKVLDVSQSSSTSGGGGTTRTSTRGPTLKPRRPTPAVRTTEPPFIGDTYMIENNSTQTDCTEGIRSLVAESGFARLFLSSIPVLQWAKHATSEEHQRLSRYPAPHGWGIDYNTLVNTLSVLNSSANGQMFDDWRVRNSKSKCIRCAVVGNGGILKDSKKGEEIDRHHYVFRTNGAIIKGFEQDVGSRTTHYTFSTNTLMNSMMSYARDGYRGPPVSNETRYVFLPDQDRDYLLIKAAATHTPVERGPERTKDPSKYFGKDVSKEKLKIFHPDFIRYLRNRFLRSSVLKTKYKDIYRPTTGGVMLLAALHTCDEVSAYGFITPDYRKYSDHYYDHSYHPLSFFVNHDMLLEMDLWQKLHKAGLIRLYMHK